MRFVRAGTVAAILALATGVGVQAQPNELPLTHWQHSMWTGRAGPPVPGSHTLVGSPDGYIWLAATNCLLRFDGVRFSVLDSLTTPALRPTGSGPVVPLFLDRRGVLWISAPGGVRITYKDGRFQRAFTLPRGASGPVAEDADGLIWMHGGKPQRFTNGRMSPIQLPASVPSDIWSVMPDTGGGLWVGTRSHGLWHVARSGVVRTFGSGEIRPLIQARDGTIWAVGLGLRGTARLDGDRWIQLRLPNEAAPVMGRAASEGRDGAIWFQTNAQGLIRYRNGVIDAYTKKDGLSDNYVHDVHVDPAGVVWATTDAGLDRLHHARFTALDRTDAVTGGVTTNVALDADGGMWIVDQSANAVRLLDGGMLGTGREPLWAKTFLVGGGQAIRLLEASPRGGVWLSVFGGDLIYLKRDGSRQTFGVRHGLPPNARFLNAIETRDGALWIEMQGSLGHLRNGKYTPISIDSVHHVRVNAFTQDGRGRLWLAWGNQPIIAVFDGDSLVRKVAAPPKSHIDNFALEHGDTLWAAWEQSVFRIIRDSVVAVAIPPLRQVLADAPAIAVAQGSLWLSSGGGIARVSLAQLHRAADGDTVTIEAQLFDELDGFEIARAASINPWSIFAGKDGRVWVNTAGGLAVTTPTPQFVIADTPRVLMEEVVVDGALATDSLRLRPKPGRLDIHFTAAGMQLPERARLQYRLEGADRGWVDAAIPRVATYNHLGPGRYVFRVRSLNDQSITGVPEATMSFRVPPAWDQAWWFFALMGTTVAAVAAGGAIAWQRRRGRVAAERAQSRFAAALAERSRIAQDLHDTLLQGFAGVTLQLKAAELALPDQPDVAAETIMSAQRLARASLREARERVWDMNESEVDIEDLPNALEAAARERTVQTATHVTLDVIGQRRRLARSLEDTAFRIGREAIANAVRHAHANHIHVDVEFGTAMLRVEVRDNGCGFTADEANEARRHGHLGLSGIRNRAERSGGRCEVISRPSGGTTVALYLPLSGSDAR